MIKQFSNEFNMYKAEKQLQVAEIENGVILPRKLCSEGPMWGLGGVCNSDNSFVVLSEYHGGWAEHGGYYSWKEEQYNDCEVLYFGVFLKHWGHFLVDLIGRMWYLCLPNVNNENLEIAYLGEEEPVGNYLEFFELLGVKSEQLIHITEPTRFKKVIVPEFSCRPCIWYTDEFYSIFTSIAKKVCDEQYSLKKSLDIRKIYFSRLNFGKAQNTEFGEKSIGKWLKENGYNLIGPETLSLRDQVYIWNHAEEIVCLNGTIPINVAFSQNENLKLVVLNKTSLIHKNLDLFLLMSVCKATFLDVFYEPFKKYPKSIGEGPFLLGISEDVKEYSKQNGMNLPFTKWQIKKEFLYNYIRLIRCILNVKGRLRISISKIIPVSLKSCIRNLLRRN